MYRENSQLSMKKRKWTITFEQVVEKRLKNVFSNVMKLPNLASPRMKIKNRDFAFTKP